jgi:hypothetical protein
MTRLPLAHWLLHRLRGFAQDRHANAAVEFALAAPALFLFIFGIIEVGYAMFVQNALDYSVAMASRCASLNGSSCAGQLSNGAYAANQAGANIDASAFSYNPNPLYPASGCGCQVTASYPLALNIPFANMSVTLTAEACNRPPPSQSCPSS